MDIITTPYIKTYLETTISLKPHQLNNNIYKNIKDAVIQKHIGKCYMNYGYITKIYKVSMDNIKGGIISMEDMSSSVLFTVSFLCKLCNPLKNSVIIARIVGIHRLLIYAQNGPISIIIKNNFIDPQTFFYNNEKNVYIIKENDKKKILDNNSYVKIRIIDKKIINNDKNIIVMGYLMSPASVDEWKENIAEEFNENSEIIDINTRI